MSDPMENSGTRPFIQARLITLFDFPGYGIVLGSGIILTRCVVLGQ